MKNRPLNRQILFLRKSWADSWEKHDVNYYTTIIYKMPEIVVKLLVFDDKRPVIVDFLKKISSFVFVNAQQIQKSLYLQSKRRGGYKNVFIYFQ